MLPNHVLKKTLIEFCDFVLTDEYTSVVFAFQRRSKSMEQLHIIQFVFCYFIAHLLNWSIFLVRDFCSNLCIKSFRCFLRVCLCSCVQKFMFVEFEMKIGLILFISGVNYVVLATALTCMILALFHIWQLRMKSRFNPLQKIFLVFFFFSKYSIGQFNRQRTVPRLSKFIQHNPQGLCVA